MKLITTTSASVLGLLALNQVNASDHGTCDDLSNMDGMVDCLGDMYKMMDKIQKGAIPNKMKTNINKMMNKALDKKAEEMMEMMVQPAGDNNANDAMMGDMEDMNGMEGMDQMGMAGNMHIEGNLIINHGQAQYEMNMGGKGPKGDKKDMDAYEMMEMMKKKYMNYSDCIMKVQMRIFNEVKQMMEEEMNGPMNQMRGGHGNHGEAEETEAINNDHADDHDDDGYAGGDKESYPEDNKMNPENMWEWESIEQFWDMYGEDIYEMADKMTQEENAFYESYIGMYNEDMREMMEGLLPYKQHMIFKFCVAKPMYEEMYWSN